jgi:hypothetical protein
MMRATGPALIGAELPGPRWARVLASLLLLAAVVPLTWVALLSAWIAWLLTVGALSICDNGGALWGAFTFAAMAGSWLLGWRLFRVHWLLAAIAVAVGAGLVIPLWIAIVRAMAT